MTIHTVVQGECLSSIAIHHGLAATDWETIYQHPNNADFRARRPNPDLIYPGDEIHIPTEEYPPKSIDLRTRRSHTVRMTRPQSRLLVYVKDREGVPYADAAYTLEPCGSPAHEGMTSGEGLVDELVPLAAGEVTLTVDLASGQQRVWTLALDHLDPVEEISGVQARLTNLGFDAGPVDDRWGPQTEVGVRAFQGAHSLAVDGIVGPNTRGMLVEIYGC